MPFPFDAAQMPRSRRRPGWSYLATNNIGSVWGVNPQASGFGFSCRPTLSTFQPVDLIRPVTPEGLPLLLDLIRELARFEKLEHEVIATPEALHESLFGPQPVAGG